MCHHFSELKAFGSAKDYRTVRAGDQILIERTDTILKRTHHARYERERSAMIHHASKIGAQVQTQVFDRYIQITFVK